MANIVEILIKLKDDTASGLNAVKSGFNQLENAANTVSGAVFNLRNSILGLAVGLGIRQVITEFSAFDDKMRAAGTIAGATGETYKRMSDLALKMGIDTKFKASEAADAMVLLGYASFKAEEQIKALPAILDMAAAGGISLADAAGISSNIIRSFSLDASEAGRVADVVAKAFTNTSTTMGELGEGWKYVAPIAAGLNTNFEELVGTLGILSNAGIKGSMGGTTLRQTLDSLLNPTGEEAKLMKDLGDRIGGAGLVVKTTEGNFVGFASIIRQLEQAGMRADEALKLFGARGGPGMAALMSQGSEAIENMRTTLENSGGTAKKIATDMTAGLGGSIIFLKSSIESFFIGLGAGLDAPFKQFIYDITTDLNNLIYSIKAAKDDGSLERWMKTGVDALRAFYDTMKSAAEGIWSFLQSNSGLVESFIKLAPTIVSVATAAAALSMALGTVKGVFAVAGLAVAPFMGMISGVGSAMTAMGFSVMATFPTFAGFGAAVGGATTGLVGLKAALIAFAAQAGIALAAIYGLYKIGEFGVELYKTINIMQETEDRLKSFNAEMNATQSEFAKFKDVQIPDNLLGTSLEDLQTLNKEVSGGIQYWTAYIVQMRATGQDSGAAFQNAIQTLAKLRGDSEKVKEAIAGYATRYRDEFKQAAAEFQSHTKLVREVADGQAKYISDAMYKAIDVEAQAYKKGEISYDEYQSRKKTITLKSEGEIESIKLKAAEQVMAKLPQQLAMTEDFNAKELENAKNVYDQKVSLLEAEVRAGNLTAGEAAMGRQKAAAEVEKVEKDSAERIIKVKTTTGEAATKEIERIQREQVKKYAENLKEEERVAKDALKSKLDALKIAEDQGKISHAEAYKGRMQIETEHYKTSLQKANENFEKAKNAYKVDSDQFKMALENKKKAADDLYNKQKEIAEKVKQLQEDEKMRLMSAEDQARAILQSGMNEKQAYQDKLNQISEKGAAAKQAELTDMKLAAELWKQQQSLISSLDTTVEGHINKVDGANAKYRLFQENNQNLARMAGVATGELQKQGQVLENLPKELKITTDTVSVKDGVAVVKTEMSQITATPVKIQVDTAALKVMSDELKSVKQQAEIIQARIDTAQPGPELDKLKERLAGVNTQAQSLQAKLDAAQPQQAIADTSAKAGEMQAKVNTPSALKVETTDAQGQVEKVGLSADDIQKKIEAGTTMKVDTSQPEKALGDVQKQTDEIDKEPVSVDVEVKETGAEETEKKIQAIPETKETAHTTTTTGTEEAIKALESIPKEIVTQHKVVSTMEASSAKPTTEKIAELSEKFGGLAKKIETPSQHKTSMTGDNGQGLTDFIAGKESEYEDFKSKIEREKTTGRLTIEGEQGNLKSSLSFVSDSYGALFDELKSGANVYSEEWAAAMNKNAESAKKMTDSVIKDGEAVIADLAKSISEAESNIKKLDEDIEKAGEDYTKLGSEIADIDKQIAESATKASEEIGKIAEDTAQKVGEISAAAVTSVGEISIKTDATVRELSQRLMTDEQKYADNKIESERLVSEAKQALAQGDFELAKKLSDEAAVVAKAMAEGANKESRKAIEDTQALIKNAAEVAKQTETAIRDAKIKAAQEEAAEKVKAIQQAEAEKKAELELKKQELVAQQTAAKAQMDILAQQREASIAQKEIATQQLAAAEQTVDAVKQMAKQFETSFKSIMDSFKSEMEGAMGEIKGNMEEPITPKVDTDPMKKALAELIEEQEKVAVQAQKAFLQTKLDYENGGAEFKLVNQAMMDGYAQQAKFASDQIKNFQNQLAKESKVNVKITGEASPQKPFGETMKDVSGSLESFLGKAEKGGKANLSFGDLQNKFGAMGRNPAEGMAFSQQMSNMLAGMGLTGGISGAGAGIKPGAIPDLGIKDMGKVDLNFGGKGYPIMGDQKVLDLLSKNLPAMLKKTITDEGFRGLI